MRSPRIAFGMNSLFAVRQFLPETLDAVRRRGFGVVVIAPPPTCAGDDPRPLFPGVEFRFVPIQREISVLRDLLVLFQLCWILWTLRPAVSNMSTPKMALLGGLAGWLARVPRRIYTLRGLRYETTSFLKRSLLMACERVACGCAHQVICISRSVRESAVLDGIAPAHKMLLLGERASEGITLSHCPESECAAARTQLRDQLHIPRDAAVLGFVGRLTRDKGIYELVEAFRILLRAEHRVILMLLGDFESGDPVDAETEVWIKTSPHVRWLGYVPEPAPYYEAMDLFVFPTRREGLGRVLLEAAAAGKPVVSTLTTGVVDAVQDGVTGILVPPMDPLALAKAADRLLRDPELAARMGACARSLVREHFDNSIYLERLATMLESLARGEPEPTLHFVGKE